MLVTRAPQVALKYFVDASTRWHRSASARGFHGWLIALVVGVSGLTAADAVQADEAASFTSIARVLLTRCLECHHGAAPAGGLDLSSYDLMLHGGDSGPALSPGDLLSSRLWQRVSAGEMPPARQGHAESLTSTELSILKGWLEQGAPWPEHRVLDPYEQTTASHAGRDWWSLQPVRRPSQPSVTPPTDFPLANPIDAFILKGLHDHQLTPASAADARTWLRRVTYGVTGLTPESADFEAFCASGHSLTAAERCRIVDRLLASPQFGVRWARFWLDLVRYADTSGYERDQEKPFAWRYRDWVVAATNNDLPYDQFILQQLAGDELDSVTEDSVIATGLLRLGTWNDEPNDPEEYQYERLEDLVHVTSTAFLGLTVKCARCHDHKYDPIPQSDYYHFAAAFWRGPIAPAARELLGGPTTEQLGYERVLGWTDIREAPPLRLLIKGDIHRPAAEMSFATLSAASGPAEDDATLSVSPRRKLAQWITSQRNPLTARVIVNRIWQFYFGQGLVRSSNNFGFRGDQPTHPELLDWLATELMENGWQLKPIHRLILTSATYAQAAEHEHFDRYVGIDATNQWWWHMQRQRRDAEGLRDGILQASDELDLRLGGRGFLPNMSDEALEGLSRKAAAWQPSSTAEQRRRSLYLFSQRSLLLPLMTTFDFVDTTLPCGQRDVTTVAPQALSLLNSEMIHEQSGRLTDRVKRVAGASTEQQIRWAWRFALGRAPTPAEQATAADFLARQARYGPNTDTSGPPDKALRTLCQVLLNTNEFLYVD